MLAPNNRRGDASEGDVSDISKKARLGLIAGDHLRRDLPGEFGLLACILGVGEGSESGAQEFLFVRPTKRHGPRFAFVIHESRSTSTMPSGP